MRIELLRQRERFEEVFADSLSVYLTNRFNWKGSIKWGPNSSSAFSSNDYLNVIFPKTIAAQKLKSLTKEYAYQPSLIKRILQTGYVAAATSPIFRPITCPRGLNIDPFPDCLQESVFLPGNHSHRIIDFNTNRSIVFHKNGFNLNFLRSEVEVRKTHHDILAPKLLQSHTTLGWYEEALISGLPHNRLQSNALKSDILLEAQKKLSELYAATGKEVCFDEYLNVLGAQLSSLAKQVCSGLHSHQTAAKLSRCVELILTNAKQIGQKTLYCCQTHGDFQPANLLASKDQAILIDWEYSKIRSYHYDALVWISYIRFPKTFEQTFPNVLKMFNEGNELVSWTGRNLSKDSRAAIWIFFMEDLELKLQELASPSMENKAPFLTDYINALYKAITILSD